MSKNALVVRGGWDGHMPVETTDLFIPHLEANGFTVRIEDSPAIYADQSVMDGIDLVMQANTMNTIEQDQVEGLRRAVAQGTGLAGWHGGIVDSYRNNSDYLQLTGGQFACHAGKDPAERKGDGQDYFVPYTVDITPLGKTHPITEGIEDFELVTEQYWVLTDEYNEVLATTTQKQLAWEPWQREVTFPAIWTRQWGQGRVFVITPGHVLDVVASQPVKTIIERGLLWAAR